ncbi:MAG: molybdopterin-dependent oxidoreductase, partial [Lachnospiraceae bacterium]|nr:molybdopterin-dependent oxidoreductase [Lachnospiraceae bacterium]
IPMEKIHIQTVQDTDVTPFDTGAYASRQTFVTGTAVRECAEKLKEKILEYAKELLLERRKALQASAQETAEMQGADGGTAPERASWLPADLCEGCIVNAAGDALLALEELAQESYYSLRHSSAITAEVSEQVKKNSLSFGATFAEIEVDIALGKIRVLDIINVHDSGRLINPRLARMQVHGGMSMGLGYGLAEQLLLDEKTGRVLNGNLLDYKLPTMMDTPDLTAGFVELEDPVGPYGNKALGEPPAISPAPALRNALLHATGVAVNEIPLSPQRLIAAFEKAGLLSASVGNGAEGKKEVGKDV